MAKVIADFGGVEMELMLRFDSMLPYMVRIDELNAVFSPILAKFNAEIARRRAKSKSATPARSVEIPLEELSVDHLLFFQQTVTSITQAMFRLKHFHAAGFFQQVGIRCYDVIREKATAEHVQSLN